MLRTVTDLTQQAVIAETEKILDAYPYYPYQKAFTTPDLRQALITYVLSRVPCVHSTIDKQKVASLNVPSEVVGATSSKLNYDPSLCWEQQLHLANLIHQGIFFILQEKPALASLHLPKTVQCSFEASHWFG